MAERRPQGLEPLRRATAVVGEPEPEHAKVVIRPGCDRGKVLRIQTQGARPRFPIGPGMAGWLMTDATTGGSSAVASAKPPAE